MQIRTTAVRLGTAIAAALVVALIASLTPAPASAHTTKFRTRVAWGMTASGGEAALGYVRSPKKKCVNRRKVKLLKVRRHKKDKVIGVDRRSGLPTGNGDGYFVIEANLREGKRYRVKVVRKNIGKNRHRHICRGYKTRALRY